MLLPEVILECVSYLPNRSQSPVRGFIINELFQIRRSSIHMIRKRTNNLKSQLPGVHTVYTFVILFIKFSIITSRTEAVLIKENTSMS